MAEQQTDGGRAAESRELLDRARRQVESLPHWKISYDVQSEVKKLVTSQPNTSDHRSE